MYEYEESKGTNKEFRNSYNMAELYKFFIYNRCNEKIVEDIINSMDYSLVKKFEKSKELYKQMLVDYANGEE